MDILLPLAALVGGFILLARGADALVDGGATLARRSGVEPWIVGLTVVAWGTSVPEVVVSALAAAEGAPEAALGNVLGSNVANIGLVLGVTGLILPRVLTGRIGSIDAAVLLASLGAVWYALTDRVVTRVEGGVLLLAFIVYTLSVFRRPRLEAAQEAQAHETSRPWVAVILGSVAIVGGARLVLYGAIDVATRLGLAQGVVGFLLLALGTSLPELAAGVSSARKGQAEIGLGNVVGSNIFNTLAVVGISSLVRPLGPPDAAVWRQAVSEALRVDMGVNLAFALVLLALPFLGRNRVKPALMVVAWVTYMAVIVARPPVA